MFVVTALGALGAVCGDRSWEFWGRLRRLRFEGLGPFAVTATPGNSGPFAAVAPGGRGGVRSNVVDFTYLFDLLTFRLTKAQISVWRGHLTPFD